jgi:AcrR family transcriptional regulator
MEARWQTHRPDTATPAPNVARRSSVRAREEDIAVARTRGQRASPEAPAASFALPVTANQKKRWSSLVGAALDLLASQPYESVQVRDITDRSGLSLATLYRYFTSKEHLFAVALLEWSESYRVRIQEVTTGTPVEQLAAPFYTAIAAFERQPHVVGVMLALMTSTDPAVESAFAEFGLAQTAALQTAVADAVPDNTETAVAVLVAVLEQHLRNWVLGREPIADVRRAIADTAELLISGAT